MLKLGQLPYRRRQIPELISTKIQHLELLQVGQVFVRQRRQPVEQAAATDTQVTDMPWCEITEGAMRSRSSGPEDLYELITLCVFINRGIE